MLNAGEVKMSCKKYRVNTMSESSPGYLGEFLITYCLFLIFTLNANCS